MASSSDPPKCDGCKVYYTKYKYQSINLCTNCSEHHRDLGPVLLTYIDKRPLLGTASPGMTPCNCCNLYFWPQVLTTLDYTPCYHEFNFCKNCARQHRTCYIDGNPLTLTAKRALSQNN